MDKTTSALVHPDLSKPLPIEVRVANNPNARKYAAASAAESRTAPKIGAENYKQWREETQAKLDRGEDYFADFARRARERSNQSTFTGWLVTGIRDKLGRDRSSKEKAMTEKTSVIADEGKQGGRLLGKLKDQPETAKDFSKDSVIVDERRQGGGGVFGKFKDKPSDVIR